MKNKAGKIIIACLAVFLAVLAAVLFAGRPYLKQWRHMETGDRYLQELDYIHAIVEYTAALEIKPDSQRVVEKLGQAYLQYADSVIQDSNSTEAEYETVLEALEDGIRLTGLSTLSEKKLEIEALLEKIRQEAALEQQEYGQERELSEEEKSLLKVLYDLFVSDEIEEVCRLLMQEEYMQLSESAENYLLYKEDGNDSCLVLFPSYCCYYGGWENNIRTGRGIEVGVYPLFDDQMGRRIHDGEWKQDKPDGEGEELWTDYNPATKEVWEHVRSGHFTEGLQNGDMVEEMHGIQYYYHVDMGQAVYIDGPDDESNWYAVSEDGDAYMSVGNRDYQFSALYYKRDSQNG